MLGLKRMETRKRLMKCNHFIAMLGVALLFVFALGAPPSGAASPFQDVTSSYWAAVQIEDLAGCGVVQGYADGSFRPEELVTRAEATKMLCLVLGTASQSEAAPSFLDLPSSFWAFPYVEAAVQARWIQGYPDGIFQPDRPVSKAELLSMIARGEGWSNPELSVQTFADLPIDHWAFPLVQSCYAHGVVRLGEPQISEDGFLHPSVPATRAQAAVFLDRALGGAEITQAQIVHGPRLGLVTAGQATITWDSDLAVHGFLWWGPTAKYTSTLAELEQDTNHHLTLTGLSPATTYHYRVQAGAAISADCSFTTTATFDQPFTFVSMADNRGSRLADDLVALPAAFSRICRQAEDLGPSFVLHSGDLFVGSNLLTEQEQLYERFKEVTDPLARQAPFLISPGNHEMSRGNPDFSPLDLFNRQFWQPAKLDGYPGTCFSWDWGNSHFVSVDSCRYDPTDDNNGMYQVRAEEQAWLEQDLKTAQEKGLRHIFVFSHANAFDPAGEAPYGLGLTPQLRDDFWQILERYGVDAYLCGHRHIFDDSSSPGQVVQWINGNSGSVAEGSNQFTYWQVEGDTVTAHLIDEYGQEDYSRTITSRQP
ncbi:MAG: S-layer homology domain-containing protein [bacterium]